MIDEELPRSRPETVTAALIFLMAQYLHTGCPHVALCVSRHLQCLALHPDAAPVVRDVCAALHGPWAVATLGRPDDAALAN